LGKRRYRLPLKRRREGITNYYKRRKLILSEKTRFIVRLTNRYVIIQLVDVHPKGDITRVSVYSKELEKYGWKVAYNNLPATYLAGYLAGLKALKEGIKEAVLDIGLRASAKGARVFVAAKGAIDAGLHIPLSEKILPSEERIRGQHIADYAKLLKETDPERYEKQFSQYIKSGLDPEKLPSVFDIVLNNIKNSF